MDLPADSSLWLAPLKETASNRPSRDPALEEEITTLFDHFRSPLLRYVLSFGLSVSDGEEVIQDVFLSLFRHLQQGRSRENLRGWIFRVAHNLALKQRCARSQEVLAEPGEPVLTQHVAPDPNPEEAMVAAQRRQRLLAVVQALPEQDRWCLQLRAEGVRYREISEILGISLGSISISLVRSLARLSRADGG
ncbi:MAG TPA: sigma-70 family RNA polymerase sigma factor [Bryobacteraceae bacterium]|nr:sigma-70 family RNA polymerase sigma factor [Bryobacteraceae bacterium]